jgi:hypothetical protein
MVPPVLAQRLAPFIEAGFLDLGALPGAKHPLQNRWYNRCSKPDMAGMHSWVAFIDLDEYMVVLDKCALTIVPQLLIQHCIMHDFCANVEEGWGTVAVETYLTI